jgi:hypothetical protein
VVHRLHAAGLQDLPDPHSVVHVAEQARELEGEPLARSESAQLAIDLVQRELGHLEQHQPPRTEPRDLPAQLRSDRSAGAAHEDHLVAHAGLEEALPGQHGVAPEQVARIHVADLLDPRLAAHEVAEARHGLHAHAQPFDLADDLGTPAARRRGHGEQDARDGLIGDHGRQAVGRQDAHAVDHAALELLLVVDESCHGQAARRADRARELNPGLPGPVDDDSLAPGARRHEQPAREHPAATDPGQGHESVDQCHGGRYGPQRRQLPERIDHRRGCRGAGHDHEDGAGTDVAHDRAVEPEGREDREAGDHGTDVQPGTASEAVREGVVLERKGDPQRRGHDARVGEQHDQSLAGPGKVRDPPPEMIHGSPTGRPSAARPGIRQNAGGPRRAPRHTTARSAGRGRDRPLSPGSALPRACRQRAGSAGW